MFVYKFGSVTITSCNFNQTIGLPKFLANILANLKMWPYVKFSAVFLQRQKRLVKYCIKKFVKESWLSLAKLNWDRQLGKLFSLPSQRNFPIFSKSSHSKVHWENAKKPGIMKSELDTMSLFLLDDLLIRPVFPKLFKKARQNAHLNSCW